MRSNVNLLFKQQVTIVRFPMSTDLFKNTTMSNKGVFVRLINPTTAIVQFKNLVSVLPRLTGVKYPEVMILRFWFMLNKMENG